MRRDRFLTLLGSLIIFATFIAKEAFLSFAHESGWIAWNPGRKLKNPKVSHQPTLPFSQDEVISILAACDRYPDNYGNLGGVTAARLRAFVLLLRYSGMRIGDAASCALDRLKGDRLFKGYTRGTQKEQGR